MRSSWPRWAKVGLVVLLGLAVLPFLGLTLFAHPYFDDYVNANATARLGRLASQWRTYQEWSGRYTTVFLSTMLNALAWWPLATHLAGLRLVLAAALLAHLVALQQFFRALLPLLVGPGGGRPAGWRGPAWGLALLVLALGLNALAEPFSFLYWYGASFVYQLAWAFSLGFGAAALRAVPLPAGAARRRWALGAAGCLVAAIGSSELALLVCAVSLAGLGWWVRRHHSAAGRLWLSWAGLAGFFALLALAAPGNWHRAALTDVYPPAGRWLLLLPRTGWAVLGLAARPLVLASTLGLAIALGWLGSRLRTVPAAAPRRADGLAALAGYALLNTIGVGFMKTFWVDPVLGRVNNLLVFVLLTSTAALALWVGTWWRPGGRRELRGGLAAGLLAGGLLALGGAGQVKKAWTELLLVAPSYDHQMQARYALLRQARAQGRPTATVPPLRLPQVPGVLVPLTMPGRTIEYSVELKPGCDYTSELATYFGLRGVCRLATSRDVGTTR